jgi:peroxiredoxin
MKKSLSTLIIILLTSALLFSCSDKSSQEEKKWDIRDQTIEEQAPDFVLEDLEGNKVALSDYKGKVVLMTFVTTWCPYCREEIPELKTLYSLYGPQGFEVIAIYIQEPKKRVSNFVSDHNIPYKILLDPKGKVARAYEVRGVPTKFLIDRQGTIICQACRSVDVALKMLFKDQPS